MREVGVLPLLVAEVVGHSLYGGRTGCHVLQGAVGEHLLADSVSGESDVLGQLFSKHRRDHQLLVLSQKCISE